MQAQWVVRAHLLESVALWAPSGEIILTVGFEPADAWPLGNNLGMVLSPQADACGQQTVRSEASLPGGKGERYRAG